MISSSTLWSTRPSMMCTEATPQRRGDLRQHPAGDGAVGEQFVDAARGEAGEQPALAIEHPGGVGEQDQLLGLEDFGDLPGDEVRVDVVGLAGLARADRRDHRDESVAGQRLDDARIDLLDLAQQVPGIDDHAVADDRQLALNHARGQQRQLVDLAVDDQRMARVVAALEPHDHVGAVAQPVDDLALALIAPLGADNGHIGHGYDPPACRDDPARPSTGSSARGLDQLWAASRQPGRCLAGCAGRVHPIVNRHGPTCSGHP